MIKVVLTALLPVLVTLLLGVLAGWRRDEDVKVAEALNRLILVWNEPSLTAAYPPIAAAAMCGSQALQTGDQKCN